MSNSTRSLVTKPSDTILIELGRIGARPQHEVNAEVETVDPR
jgi:hypothetical protein